jgi:hypothetical protein
LTNKPALASYYESAHMQVLGKKCFIRPEEYAMFETFMDDLRELNIGYRDYAQTVVKLLEKWLEKKKFYRVPINVFCGDWALSKFRSIENSEYVSVADTDEDAKTEILQSELLVARAYVDGNLKDVCRMTEIIKDLKPLLSKKWLECSKSERPIDEVVEILCKEYGIKPVADYNELIGRLRCRK